MTKYGITPTEKYINKMMEMCGYNARYHHLKAMGDYPWYSEYTCTKEEAAAFRDWFITQERKRRTPLSDIVRKYAAFWFMWGLKEI